MKKSIVLFVVDIENLKNLKTLVLFVICSKCESEDEQIFKWEE